MINISAYAVTETRPQPKEIISLPPSPARMAVCGGVHLPDHSTLDPHKVIPSSKDLAFFEFRGLGSEAATLACRGCHFHLGGHEVYGLTFAGVHEFEPHGPWEYDSFYCGHNGWD